jgi:hypothetical protein
MLEKSNFKDKILWLVFGIFIVITLWGLMNHLPWRDEAQSWLIVRDLNFLNIIKQMPYEGTPPLWHLILYPFAKLGLPYVSELIIHYIIAILAVFIFLFFSPLPKSVKILLPFTYYFLFEYSIVARNYSLTAFILFLIATLYQNRFKKPVFYAILIFLLAWTNVHSLGISVLLLILFIYDIIKNRYEEKKYLIAIIVMMLGLTSAILIMIPQIDQYTTLILNSWYVLPRSLASALIPFLNNPGVNLLILSTVSLLWLPIILFILKNWETKVIFVFSYLWLLFIFLFKHPGDLRHYGLILILFIFVWWVDILKNKTNYSQNTRYRIIFYLFLCCLIINILYAGYFYISGNNKYFSGAKEMTEYLKNNDLLKNEIAAYPSYSGSALLPYLPGKKFYQMETLKEGTFLTWNKDFVIGNQTPYYILKAYLKKYYQNQTNQIDRILLITTIPEGYDPELTLITKTKKETIKQDEFFYLYWLNLK